MRTTSTSQFVEDIQELSHTRRSRALVAVSVSPCFCGAVSCLNWREMGLGKGMLSGLGRDPGTKTRLTLENSLFQLAEDTQPRAESLGLLVVPETEP